MTKIAIITGTRAEYGLLKPLISAVDNDPDFELQLYVTGMHLSKVYGNTYQAIEADGFIITTTVDSALDADTAVGISKSTATTLSGFAEAFSRLTPDLVIVLGDRSEIFAAATAAYIQGLPIAHIHGGETTEGAYDEAFRHSITKMSYLHFTSAEVYRKRVIQLGEHPNRVFTVGAIGIDSIKSLPLLSKQEFEKAIDFKLDEQAVSVTFHPVTLENNSAKKQFQELLEALDVLEHTTLIFTKPNADKDGGILIKMIDDYVAKNPNKAIAFKSLGHLRYLSSLQFVDVVIGNSSSGILEVPLFKKASINIGNRQKGRLMPTSVINCEPNKQSISEAIKKGLSASFKKEIETQTNPYGEGNATKNIMSVLKQTTITSIEKSFYDL
ncbi:UDP-N-acetylglucosamine 2-epimerase [Lacinutrix salivirga]